MAQIIDIRKRLRDAAAVGHLSFRIRLGGPDLHWLGVVGGILGGALREEGVPAAVVDGEASTGSAPLLELIAGSDPAPVLGLLVADAALSTAMLRGCSGRTVWLASRQKAGWTGAAARDFPGRLVELPMSDPAPTPLRLAVACAGGAARLLGIVSWRALEQALHHELLLAEPLEPYLIPAFESYHRLAPWAGAVATTAEGRC